MIIRAVWWEAVCLGLGKRSEEVVIPGGNEAVEVVGVIWRVWQRRGKLREESGHRVVWAGWLRGRIGDEVTEGEAGGHGGSCG